MELWNGFEKNSLFMETIFLYRNYFEQGGNFIKMALEPTH